MLEKTNYLYFFLCFVVGRITLRFRIYWMCSYFIRVVARSSLECLMECGFVRWGFDFGKNTYQWKCIDQIISKVFWFLKCFNDMVIILPWTLRVTSSRTSTLAAKIESMFRFYTYGATIKLSVRVKENDWKK